MRESAGEEEGGAGKQQGWCSLRATAVSPCLSAGILLEHLPRDVPASSLPFPMFLGDSGPLGGLRGAITALWHLRAALAVCACSALQWAIILGASLLEGFSPAPLCPLHGG